MYWKVDLAPCNSVYPKKYLILRNLLEPLKWLFNDMEIISEMISLIVISPRSSLTNPGKKTKKNSHVKKSQEKKSRKKSQEK